MVTTIQVSEELKEELAELKQSESYEDVIRKLLKSQKKMIIRERMKEYGKKYGDSSLDELKEWEHTDVKW